MESNQEGTSSLGRSIEDYVEAVGVERAKEALERLEGLSSPSVESRLETQQKKGAEEKTEGVLERVGPYRLIRELGRGGMGIVYLAEQRTPIRREVALKVIRPEIFDRGAVSRFENERQSLASLDHANIAKILDARTTESGLPYFAMEHISGPPLIEYFAQNNVSLRDRLMVLMQVVEAVQHAHQKGVIHRDLKPSNILMVITESGAVPKVIDFGIAKAMDRRRRDRAETRIPIGTWEYMSPEQFGYSGGDVDTRTDLYALGVIFYESIVGCLPFDEERFERQNSSELQRMIAEELAVKPSVRVRAIAGRRECDTEVQPVPWRALRRELDWIAMKAIAKDREERYQTAREFSEDIRKYLSGDPVTAGPQGTLYRLGKMARRHRTVVALCLFFVLSLAVGIVGIGMGLVEAERQARIARQREGEARRSAQLARRQESLADEARCAEEVVRRFLERMLLSVDPRVLGRNVKFMEVIEQASQAIEEWFGGQPETEASIRTILGTVSFQFGHLSIAERQLSVAYEIYRVETPESSKVGIALGNLALLAEAKGESDSAVASLRTAIEIAEKKLSKNDRDLLTLKHNLGRVLLTRGRIGEAEDLLVETYERRRKSLGEVDLDTLNSANTLAVMRKRQGQFEEAEALYRRVLRGRGKSSPYSAAARHNLAVCLDSQGKLEDAETEARAALASHIEIFGERHRRSAESRASLGRILSGLKRFSEAEELQRAALEVFEEVSGEDHFDTLVVMSDLASSLRCLDTTETRAESRELYESVLERSRRSAGDVALVVATARLGLGTLLLREGETERTGSVFKKARGFFRSRFGAEDERTKAADRGLRKALEEDEP